MRIAAVIVFALAAAAPFSAMASTVIHNPHDQGHPTTRQDDATDRCTVLQSQYDSVIGGQADRPGIFMANKLHQAGVVACESNNIDVGAMKLEQALRQLGVRPSE